MKITNKNIIIFVFFLILGTILSIEHKQGTCWDLLTYHLYIPWAFLNGRYDIDFCACGIHSFFNPIGMIPYYLMLKYLNSFPVLIAVFQGWVWSIFCFFVYLISCKIFKSDNKKVNTILSLLASIIGCTTAVIYMQIGSGTLGLSSCLPALFGAYLLVGGIDKSKKLFVIGLMMGISFALKLTNGIYVLSTFFVILCYLLFNLKLSFKEVLKKVLIYTFGSVVGFLIIDGYWMYFLYSKFENPFFPFFNNIFKSDLYTPVAYHDDRYLIKNVFDLLILPIKNIVQVLDSVEKYKNFLADVVTHHSIYDVRFGVGYICCLLLLFVRKISSFIKLESKIIDFSKLTILLYFYFFSYVIWALAFKILRYFVPALSLSGLFFLIIFVLFAEFSKKYKTCIAMFIVSVILIYSTVFTPFNYERSEFDTSALKIPRLFFEDNSAVVFAGKPMSYIALKQNKNVKYIGFDIEVDGKEDLRPTEKYYEKAFEIMNNSSKVYVITTPRTDKNIVDVINSRLKPELKLKGKCRQFYPNVAKHTTHTGHVFDVFLWE